MNSKPLLITGSSGQLGQELKSIWREYLDIEPIFAERKDFDLSNSQEIQRFCDSQCFSAILHCGAYTAVDKAQEDAHKAYAVNQGATQALAKIAVQKNIPMVLVSTDFVFDGNSSKAYLPGDATNPIGVYGKSKLAGEYSLRESGASFWIVRTAWVYSSFGHNFVKTMLKLGQDRSELKVVNDQIGSPTYALDLAHALLKGLQSPLPNAIEHYSNEGVCSWYDFAHAIMEESRLNCKIYPIPSTEYPTPAKRPAFSLLDKTEIKTRLQLDVPHWRDSLKACLEKM